MAAKQRATRKRADKHGSVGSVSKTMRNDKARKNINKTVNEAESGSRESSAPHRSKSSKKSRDLKHFSQEKPEYHPLATGQLANAERANVAAGISPSSSNIGNNYTERPSLAKGRGKKVGTIGSIAAASGAALASIVGFGGNTTPPERYRRDPRKGRRLTSDGEEFDEDDEEQGRFRAISDDPGLEHSLASEVTVAPHEGLVGSIFSGQSANPSLALYTDPRFKYYISRLQELYAEKGLEALFDLAALKPDHRVQHTADPHPRNNRPRLSDDEVKAQQAYGKVQIPLNISQHLGAPEGQSLTVSEAAQRIGPEFDNPVVVHGRFPTLPYRDRMILHRYLERYHDPSSFFRTNSTTYELGYPQPYNFATNQPVSSHDRRNLAPPYRHLRPNPSMLRGTADEQRAQLARQLKAAQDTRPTSAYGLRNVYDAQSSEPVRVPWANLPTTTDSSMVNNWIGDERSHELQQYNPNNYNNGQYYSDYTINTALLPQASQDAVFGQLNQRYSDKLRQGFSKAADGLSNAYRNAVSSILKPSPQRHFSSTTHEYNTAPFLANSPVEDQPMLLSDDSNHRSSHDEAPTEPLWYDNTEPFLSRSSPLRKTDSTHYRPSQSSYNHVGHSEHRYIPEANNLYNSSQTRHAQQQHIPNEYTHDSNIDLDQTTASMDDPISKHYRQRFPKNFKLNNFGPSFSRSALQYAPLMGQWAQKHPRNYRRGNIIDTTREYDEATPVRQWSPNLQSQHLIARPNSQVLPEIVDYFRRYLEESSANDEDMKALHHLPAGIPPSYLTQFHFPVVVPMMISARLVPGESVTHPEELEYSYKYPTTVFKPQDEPELRRPYNFEYETIPQSHEYHRYESPQVIEIIGGEHLLAEKPIALGIDTVQLPEPRKVDYDYNSGQSHHSLGKGQQYMDTGVSTVSRIIEPQELAFRTTERLKPQPLIDRWRALTPPNDHVQEFQLPGPQQQQQQQARPSVPLSLHPYLPPSALHNQNNYYAYLPTLPHIVNFTQEHLPPPVNVFRGITPVESNAQERLDRELRRLRRRNLEIDRQLQEEYRQIKRREDEEADRARRRRRAHRRNSRTATTTQSVATNPINAYDLPDNEQDVYALIEEFNKENEIATDAAAYLSQKKPTKNVDIDHNNARLPFDLPENLVNGPPPLVGARTLNLINDLEHPSEQVVAISKKPSLKRSQKILPKEYIDHPRDEDFKSDTIERAPLIRPAPPPSNQSQGMYQDIRKQVRRTMSDRSGSHNSNPIPQSMDHRSLSDQPTTNTDQFQDQHHTLQPRMHPDIELVKGRESIWDSNANSVHTD